MTFFTGHPSLTPRIFKTFEFIIKIPIHTFLRLVQMLVGISPKILNIMCIDTSWPIMGQCVRTPNCLVLLQIEIMVPVEKMNHLYFNFSLSVSKSAELFVLAPVILVFVRFTELRFEPTGVINLLNFIVREGTVLQVTLGTSAHLVRVIPIVGSAPIGLVMVVDACFPFMIVWIVTKVPLRVHRFILWVLISNLKNSPYWKCFWSYSWKRGHNNPNPQL